MRNNDLIITICLDEIIANSHALLLESTFKKNYQTDKVVVVNNAGFNQISITDPITNTTTLLNQMANKYEKNNTNNRTKHDSI
jgi:hypothetical protein